MGTLVTQENLFRARKQESRIYTPDQSRGDGVLPINRTKNVAIAIDQEKAKQGGLALAQKTPLFETRKWVETRMAS